MPTQSAFVVSLLVGADAHGSMIMPPGRNSIDAETPAWSDGKHPNTGWIEPYNCGCINGTDVCNNGQSCFWFSNGCTPGCKACSGNGNRYPNFDHCPDEEKDLKPEDKLSKEYWTGDPTWEEGTSYDIFKFNPWRAPGKAPVFDPCGMAGGRWTEAFNAAAYNTTKFAKMGDLGSKVLKPRRSGTVWSRGGRAKTRWQLTATHGGGYLFRLCPASEALTEECFQRMPLKWATSTHMLRFADASQDFEVNATEVTRGGGKGWRRMPFPDVRRDPCDYNVTEKEGPDHHCAWDRCPGCKAPYYLNDEACPDVCSKHYPGTPDGRQPTLPFPDPAAGHWTSSFAVEDTLEVPADVPVGEYVLGWRWDCEHSSQVWSSCADITIADAEPTPVPAPTPTPSPCVFEKDVDFDIHNTSTMVVLPASSEQECCDACGARRGCGAAVFFEGSCYPKDAWQLAKKVARAGRVSCVPAASTSISSSILI